MEQIAIFADGTDDEAARLVQGGGSSTVRDAVARCFHTAAEAHGVALAALKDEAVLLDTGLDSLCFAIIVAQLEDELGVDPFSDADDVFFPDTFSEFVGLYEAAAQRLAAR